MAQDPSRELALSLVERVSHDASASCRLLQCFATSEIPRRKVNTFTVSPLYLDRCNDDLAQASCRSATQGERARRQFGEHQPEHT